MLHGVRHVWGWNCAAGFHGAASFCAYLSSKHTTAITNAAVLFAAWFEFPTYANECRSFFSSRGATSKVHVMGTQSTRSLSPSCRLRAFPTLRPFTAMCSFLLNACVCSLVVWILSACQQVCHTSDGLKAFDRKDSSYSMVGLP